MGLSAHQKNGGHDEWLTPPEILRALGAFDLDPCAPVMRARMVQAGLPDCSGGYVYRLMREV